MSSGFSNISVIDSTYDSASLQREVALTIILPPGHTTDREWPLLLFNDGQDFDALKIVPALAGLYTEGSIPGLVIVGIHANQNRIYEYGTAGQPDYAGRGSKAADTTSFVINELVPFLGASFNARTSGITYAGFSLGGLMAMDVAWNYSGMFAAAGVFSGSLWWRQKALNAGYDDSDLIMHAQIRETPNKPNLKCWFQCGTFDEYDDRDGDGIIDSIQDTLECISEMERKGFVWNKDVFYTEVVEGRHNQDTWAKVLPAFLKWVSTSVLN